MNATRIILPTLALAAAAFAQDVRYNFAADADFAKYKTYKWVQIKRAEQLDQLADSQLKAAVDAELATKGLIKTEGESADLFIGYQASINREKQLTSYNNGWGYGRGWGRGGISTMTSSTIQIGQLDLDMYDAPDKKLVWRGTVSKTLDPNAKPEKRQKNLQKAVAKLLKNYPPPQKKA